MRVGAVIIGRLGSQRLPGKVLREVAGRPLLEHVLVRLERVTELDSIVAATSAEPADDAIEQWAERRGVGVHRGPVHDVLGRVLGAARQERLDAIVRANGDSPWIDPALVSQAVRLMRRERPDLVTNLLRRAWPYGVAAEVARVDALARIHRDASAEEREHLTSRFYGRPQDFSILALPVPGDLGSDLRLTVDTEEDVRRFERMLVALGSRAGDASTKDVVAAARALEPEAHVRRP